MGKTNNKKNKGKNKGKNKATMALVNSNLPSIQQRGYIFFLPHPIPPTCPLPYTPLLPSYNPLNIPPYYAEPTTTFTLTSPSGTYTTVQIYNTAPNLPNGSITNFFGSVGSSTHLEHAFGGYYQSAAWVNERILPGDLRFEYGERVAWTHWLDSRLPVLPLGPSNEFLYAEDGEMYYVPLMDANVTIVSGFNLVYGCAASVESLHYYHPVRTTYPDLRKVSVVLRIEVLREEVRGLVVRVGHMCQAIMRKKEKTTVERWEFVEEETEDEEGNRFIVGGSWMRLARIGGDFLPCVATFKPELLRLGGTVHFYDFQWHVEELVEWDD
ncbi:hypothetical protein BS50DRAFT_657821 [Corynespora cassiicola Philippines]|uniref:Uncharacterized protein n=1 Tax=Corynespora cassiicola Philippines TaxID=1448308 RepID=A0A2T2P2X1_CORCC|nr:hypothetical protein BS50DRAFT_657821 [Corynespora cassiicola Philippines]